MSSAEHFPWDDSKENNHRPTDGEQSEEDEFLPQTCGQSKYPSAVWYILGTEFCERFTYYGMRAILIIYLTRMLKIDDDSATAIYHGFNMLCYFSPLFGSVLADSWFGKYRVILYLSLAYAVGNAVVAVTSVAPILDKVKLAGPLIGLVLIALCTGGIKPCVSTFGGDQFTASQSHLIQGYFAVFYFTVNVGSCITTFVTPLLRADVQCFGNDCYPLAFGVPAFLMILAVVIFFCGRNKYRNVPPAGYTVLDVAFVIGYAIKHRCQHKGPGDRKEGHWMDWAKDKYDDEVVEDIKALLKVLFMFLPLPVYWALYDQQGSRWTLQAEEMDGNLGLLGSLQPDQMQTVNAVLILVMIPVFQTAVYPALRKCKLLTRQLQRMTVGMFLAAASFVMAGFVQIAIQKNRVYPPVSGIPCIPNIKDGSCSPDLTARYLSLGFKLDELMIPPVTVPKPLSMLWQIPQYVTITAAEILYSITGLEFAYSQAPVSMKSGIMAGWLLTVAVGNALVVMLAENPVTDNMAHEFFFFAGLMVLVTLLFMLMAHFYEYVYYTANGRTKPSGESEYESLMDTLQKMTNE